MSIPLIYRDEVAETIIVKRTQRIHHPGNDDISYNCHLSKNLWNQTHHVISDHREDHTSKCSFLGSESIEHHDAYMGKRIHRGLFKCSIGVDISAWIGSKKKKIIDTINADVQGAYNGLRHVSPRFNVFDIMEGLVDMDLCLKD